MKLKSENLPALAVVSIKPRHSRSFWRM